MPYNFHIFYEYQALDKDLSEKIYPFIENSIKLQNYFSSGWGQIKTSNYCGSIDIDNESILILPKIENEQNIYAKNLEYLIYIISYVYDINLYETYTNIDNFKNQNILKFYITIFIKALEAEGPKGLYNEYITYEDNLNKLKGRYLVNEDSKYNLIKTKIYCQYDEFTENNYLNQIFAFTIHKLRAFSKNEENKKRLASLSLLFVDVDLKDFSSININPYYTFNRNNERFKKTYDIAIFILKKLSIYFDYRNKKFFSFIFNMNELFEMFIGKLIKETLPREFTVKLQSKSKLGEFKIKPDIIIFKYDKPILIIDTKYKKITAQKDITTCDLYQIYAYGMSYPDWINNRRNVMLLYPKHLIENLIISSQRLGNIEFEETIVNLKVEHIDIKNKHTDYNDYLFLLKEEIKQILNL
ncbi:MAG: hypothetical protein KA792_00410 [Bacteroidales bacterium]|nr:hypothetical protein [Bacteroidales bacterium]